MIHAILIIALLVVVLVSLAMGFVIIYHFRRLGTKDDPAVKKILLIFEIGGLAIIAANLLLFFFVIF